mgnify:CR=1 FL=1
MTCREIADGVYLIDTLPAGVPGLVASYLVRGEKSALIDAGHATSAKTVLSELRTLGGGNPHLDYLIPTHVHLDHAGAISHLAKAIPNALVLVNEHGAKHMVDPTKLIQHQEDLFGKESLSIFGAPAAVPRERVESVRELCNLDLGAGKRLRLLWTPGHAPHHMSAFLENERLLVTGDAVGLHYPGFDFPIPATPPPSFDENQYVKTLSRFMDMNPAGLLLPHFGPVLENVTGFLQANLETIRRWGSDASRVLKVGGSVNDIFELFITDIAGRAGKSRGEIPDLISKSIMLSASGYDSYLQKMRTKK